MGPLHVGELLNYFPLDCWNLLWKSYRFSQKIDFPRNYFQDIWYIKLMGNAEADGVEGNLTPHSSNAASLSLNDDIASGFASRRTPW